MAASVYFFNSNNQMSIDKHIKHILANISLFGENYLSLLQILRIYIQILLLCVLKSIRYFSAAAATGGSVLNVAALLASGTQVTPQIAMAAQMAALQAKALAETGIAVPSYYNPAAVNPMKFAEQEKKRKMLWQGKKEGVSFCVFSSFHH